MNRHVYRRRRSWSFRMIACVHHRRASGGGWPGSDGHPGGTSDRRGVSGGNGNVVQTNVASILVDGRRCGGYERHRGGIGHRCGGSVNRRNPADGRGDMSARSRLEAR